MKNLKLMALGTVAALTATAFEAPAKAQVDPLLGQVGIFGFNFCPRGWADAGGALLPISQNSALFSLLGTIYGGDGRTTFALPDLRGRSVINEGQGPGLPRYVIGQRGGAVDFTLNVTQMPSHNHNGTIRVFPSAGTTGQARQNTIADSPDTNFGSGGPGTAFMAPNSLNITNTGGGQAVDKVSPFLTMKVCVATEGVFPSRS